MNEQVNIKTIEKILGKKLRVQVASEAGVGGKCERIGEVKVQVAKTS